MHNEKDIRTKDELIEDLKYELARLDEDERLDIFSYFCVCGSNDKTCQCWDNE